MPTKEDEEQNDTIILHDRVVCLLEKILVFQLHAIGIPQPRIAKTVGRQLNWVNDLVKGIPKGGKSDG